MVQSVSAPLANSSSERSMAFLHRGLTSSSSPPSCVYPLSNVRLPYRNQYHTSSETVSYQYQPSSETVLSLGQGTTIPPSSSETSGPLYLVSSQPPPSFSQVSTGVVPHPEPSTGAGPSPGFYLLPRQAFPHLSSWIPGQDGVFSHHRSSLGGTH